MCIRDRLPIVLTAVEFDDDPRFATGEVHDERADQNLPTKMRSRQRDVMTKPLPEHALGIGRLRAHLPRKLSLAIWHRVRANHIRHRLWTPTPRPLPARGRGA